MDDVEWTVGVAEQLIQELTANLLRCARGAGKPHFIISQMEAALEAAHACAKLIGDTRTDTKLASALQTWDSDANARWEALEWNNGSYERWNADGTLEACEAKSQNIKGCLQIVASRMVGQPLQTSRGEADVSMAMNTIFEIRRRKEAERKQREIQSAPVRVAPVRVAANDNQPREIVTYHRDEDAMLYFISDGTAVKIGVSNDPRRRLAGLQTAHHKPLKMLATMDGGYTLEAELHGKFQEHRLHGEWFTPAPEIMAYIEANTPQTKAA